MLVLASSSPRRAMLLQEWGFRFKIIEVSVSENLPEDINPWEGVKILAQRKAEEGSKAWMQKGGAPEDIILGADTMVILKDSILGKPINQEEAEAMLRRLSGNEHSVITGVALLKTSGEKEVFVVETNVWFRELEDKEIKDYVASGEPLDKAGAYGIQGEARKFVESFSGSLTNVIGLPMELLAEKLSAWGI